MHSLFSKVVCLLLLTVTSVAQVLLDSKAGPSTYPTTADTVSSVAVGPGSIDGARQFESIALDPISPSESDLDETLTQQDSQCPAGDIYQRSRKLRGRGKSCENPAANPPSGQEKPPQSINWRQQFGMPDPTPETGYVKTEPHDSEEYCPYPVNRIPVCSLQSVFVGTVAPSFERLVLPDSRICKFDDTFALLPLFIK